MAPQFFTANVSLTLFPPASSQLLSLSVTTAQNVAVWVFSSRLVLFLQIRDCPLFGIEGCILK